MFAVHDTPWICIAALGLRARHSRKLKKIAREIYGCRERGRGMKGKEGGGVGEERVMGRGEGKGRRGGEGGRGREVRLRENSQRRETCRGKIG